LITVGVIPVRFDSKRLPGKVLLKIAGKTVLQHVYERASKCSLLDRIIIATDDSRIADCANGISAECFLSQSPHSCGTERVAEAVRHKKADVVVNIQGDEVLLQPRVIELAVSAAIEDRRVDCGTVCHPINSLREFNDENLVKVVLDDKGRALYFSRSPIPNGSPEPGDAPLRLGHIGVYAFRKRSILRFAKLGPTPLERAERLEQLRLLESGMVINVRLTKVKNVSLNSKRDIPAIERLIRLERR
jgi:3-deoxy-manno-octulosonate cytidylyltransferase (CMP-KDO synthetase)